jgi:antitoxin component YwqK of YwqJK toxin-antitoxin module
MTTIKRSCKFVIYTNMYGIRSKYFIFNGKKEGECKSYDESGQLWDTSNYKNGKNEGEYKKYYYSGQLEIQCNYKNNKLEGEFKEYYTNGRLKDIYNYENGQLLESWI